QPDEAVERYRAFAHTEVVEHVQPFLDARPAVRDHLEVLSGMTFLLRPLERAMVGREHREDVGAESLPERLLLLLGSRRRRVDVLGALEPRLIELGVVDEEVLGAGLAPHVPTLLARELDRLDRRLAGDMDAV